MRDFYQGHIHPSTQKSMISSHANHWDRLCGLSQWNENDMLNSSWYERWLMDINGDITGDRTWLARETRLQSLQRQHDAPIKGLCNGRQKDPRQHRSMETASDWLKNNTSSIHPEPDNREQLYSKGRNGNHTLGGFLKCGYPQFSSISSEHFSIKTQFGIPLFRKPPLRNWANT